MKMVASMTRALSWYRARNSSTRSRASPATAPKRVASSSLARICSSWAAVDASSMPPTPDALIERVGVSLSPLGRSPAELGPKSIEAGRHTTEFTRLLRAGRVLQPPAAGGTAIVLAVGAVTWAPQHQDDAERGEHDRRQHEGDLPLDGELFKDCERHLFFPASMNGRRLRPPSEI